MVCDVCGLEFATAHACSGKPIPESVRAIIAAEMAVPEDAGLLYYATQAWKIVRWDDAAVRRNAKDPRALMYGILFWLLAAVSILIVSTAPQVMLQLRRLNLSAKIVAVIVGLSFACFLAAVVTLVQISLCHAIAKWMFGGKGRLIELMRPLLLAWYINCLMLVPVVGTIVGAILWIGVVMLVFEEIEGIERMKAFGISVVVNISLLGLQFYFIQ